MESPPQVVVIAAPFSAGTLIHPLRAAGYRVGVVSSIDRWHDEARSAHPQCVVIGVEADADAIPAVSWAGLRDRGAEVVVVYGGTDLRFVVRAMREGAVDLLPAPADGDALVAAVAQGVAKAAAAHHDVERGSRARALLDRCTPRERTIILHVTRGLRNKAIAHDLACKESTVKVHRSRAMRTLGLRSLAELVRLVELAGGAPAPEPHASLPRRAVPPSAYPRMSPAYAVIGPGD